MFYEYLAALTPDDYFTFAGSFGRVRGELVTENGTVSCTTADYRVSASFTEGIAGVTSRTDTFTNCSDKAIELRAARSVFVLDGGEWEVYTQYNGWQNESRGGWQPLVTGVYACSATNRLSLSAVPMIALWNKAAERGFVFHLLPNCGWSISARLGREDLDKARLIVEIGLADDGLRLSVAPGETITMPEILCYCFRNRIDLDCYRLHRYLNGRLAEHPLPVVYNTWMYHFDRITPETLTRQAQLAAELGAEYFVVDAGWFGTGADWAGSRGDWVERTEGGLAGGMAALAEKVRALGMGFGLWLEIESADPTAKAVAAHPAYYINSDGRYFYNFSLPEAADAMFETVCGLARTYGIAWIKFDFNQEMTFDAENMAFRSYFAAYEHFMKRLREALPGVYFENCGSGGQRLHLKNALDFDGFWLSDNQSPYEGLRIVTEGMLRMAPQRIERWACVTSYRCTQPNDADKLLACDDATWSHLRTVDFAWLKGFLAGGGLGISCDLTEWSPAFFAAMKELIASYKAERPFWRKAEGRILAETDNITVLQYADPAAEKIVVSAFMRHVRQKSLRLFPVLDEQKRYRLPDGTVKSGKDLSEYGIPVTVRGAFTAEELVLTQSK